MARKTPAAPIADVPDSTTDLVLLHDTSGQRYRCVGTQWCGAEQWLLLVLKCEVENHTTAAKRVVSRDLVREAQPRKQDTLW